MIRSRIITTAHGLGDHTDRSMNPVGGILTTVDPMLLAGTTPPETLAIHA
jgi:hypothetical protein